jgi:arsenical pump membrane protein
VVLAAWHLATRRSAGLALAQHLNLPLLLGLFGAASALGTLGRAWSGPTHLLGHLGSWQTAGVGAGASIVVNNLPAASLLAARPVAHAAALLIGLNLGPNLALSGSLAGVLWFQASRAAGWTPSIRRFSYLGLAVVPITMAASLGALALSH